MIKSVNPYNNQILATYPEMSVEEAAMAVELCYDAWLHWKKISFETRAEYMNKAADVLRLKKDELAKLITLEMGKRIAESVAEIEKCAWVCEYYASNTENLLLPESIETDASLSQIVFQPMGPVLAIMPWNYPFWQTFRFAAPALMAGNTGLLKHSSNVQGCALAIEKVFLEAGFPENVFRTLVIGASKVESIIAHPKVMAVTLTGSEAAGRSVASIAGKHLKKSVLELGGSDPCIVLWDANIDEAVEVGIRSRMLTSGQTCISAKRFIVEQSVVKEFIKKAKSELKKYKHGDPLDPKTKLAPLARENFAAEIHQQVTASVLLGAKLELGGDYTSGCFYPATLLTNVTPDMPVFYQETFGPVVAVIEVADENEAIEMANNSNFGLGAAIWTTDLEKAQRLSLEIEVGAVFVNWLVKSDPRLPFGGIKNSGYGRELSHYGLKEFCNIKSIWIK